MPSKARTTMDRADDCPTGPIAGLPITDAFWEEQPRNALGQWVPSERIDLSYGLEPDARPAPEPPKHVTIFDQPIDPSMVTEDTFGNGTCLVTRGALTTINVRSEDLGDGVTRIKHSDETIVYVVRDEWNRVQAYDETDTGFAELETLYESTKLKTTRRKSLDEALAPKPRQTRAESARRRSR